MPDKVDVAALRRQVATIGVANGDPDEDGTLYIVLSVPTVTDLLAAYEERDVLLEVVKAARELRTAESAWEAYETEPEYRERAGRTLSDAWHSLDAALAALGGGRARE